MIFRPVSPASPIGPPIVNAPVPFTMYRVLTSSHSPTTGRITCSRIFALARFESMIDALRDLARLLLDGRDNAAGPVVKTVIGVRVADLLHHIAHEPDDVHVGLRGDLAGHEDGPRCRRGLASDPRVGVLAEALVEHSVRDLVAELVRVTLGHRLAREEHAIGLAERLGHA